MKKLFFALYLVLTLAFAACGGSSREALFNDVDALIEKTIELSTKAAEGDQNAMAELDKTTEEAAKLEEKHKETIEKLSDEDKMLMTAKMMKLMGAMM